MDQRSARIAPLGGESLPHGEITGAIIGAFYEVYNILRPGYLEAVYARAMELELTWRNIAHVREAHVDVYYTGHVVGVYRPDFLVAGRVVVELKATQAIGDADKRQLLNYLRGTELEVGLLLHFGPEAKFHRIIRSTSAKPQLRADRTD
jgi:GxxExxY protein